MYLDGKKGWTFLGGLGGHEEDGARYVVDLGILGRKREGMKGRKEGKKGRRKAKMDW
jgi:hypothetical protein